MSSIADVGDQEFEHSVLQGSRSQPVLVFFWAPWLRSARALGKVLDDLAIMYAGRLQIFRVDIDDNGRLMEIYGIDAAPALALFKGGEKVCDWTGETRRDVLESALSGYL
jgi:thioredoxin 1